MGILRQGGPEASVDVGTDAWEARVGDGGEDELGRGTANLLKVRGELRLPGCGCGGCWVRSRHGMLEEVGEAGRGRAGCQSGGLKVGSVKRVLFYSRDFQAGVWLKIRDLYWAVHGVVWQDAIDLSSLP